MIGHATASELAELKVSSVETRIPGEWGTERRRQTLGIITGYVNSARNSPHVRAAAKSSQIANFCTALQVVLVTLGAWAFLGAVT